MTRAENGRIRMSNSCENCDNWQEVRSSAYDHSVCQSWESSFFMKYTKKDEVCDNYKEKTNGSQCNENAA